MMDRVVDFRLADGEARHAESPRTFFIPSRSERENLRPGDLVKLVFEIVDPQLPEPGAERMWVEVTGVEDGRYIGALNNVPSTITTISLGDRVDFGPEHIISTLGDWALLDLRVFVSRRSHELDLRPGYVYREDPDSERDSGWRAMVGDETQAEVDEHKNILFQELGYLLDRWPELLPVLKTDPHNGAWVWDEAEGRYVPEPD